MKILIEKAVIEQALEALIDSDDGGGLRYTEVQAVAALREALEVTEASISDHKSEQVMVSVDFLRHLEARFSYYGELVDGEWGNGRDIEELDAAHLLPEEVYQIRKILEEAPVFGFTQAHTSDKPLHHYALVLRDLDKTDEPIIGYAAPVRTKDLTDDELREIMKQPFNQREYLEQFARAVIAADREKNK